jgi:hypothetical protein
MLFIYQRQGRTGIHINSKGLKSCMSLRSEFPNVDGVFFF